MKKKTPAAEVQEKIYLTYPPDLIKEPIIYELGQQFDVRTNIRGANVSGALGLVALEKLTAAGKKSKERSPGCAGAALRWSQSRRT